MQLSPFLKHYFQTTHVQGCTRRLLLLAHVVDASLEWLSVLTLVGHRRCNIAGGRRVQSNASTSLDSAGVFATFLFFLDRDLR